MMPDLPNVGLERDIAQFIVSEIEHNNLMFCFYIRIFSYSFVCFFCNLRSSLKIQRFAQMV